MLLVLLGPIKPVPFFGTMISNGFPKLMIPSDSLKANPFPMTAVFVNSESNQAPVSTFVSISTTSAYLESTPFT